MNHLDRRAFLKSGAAFCSALAVFPFRYAAPQDAAGAKSGLRVLVCEGKPRLRGRIHGETFRDEIGTLVAIWKDSLARRYGTKGESFIEEFLADTRFDDAARRWTPGLWDEVCGIAEGANLPLDTIAAFQCIDEEWWYGRNRQLGIEPPARRPAGVDKCSVVAAFGQGGAPAVLGQNLDIMDYFDGYQVLLHTRHHESSLESFALTSPGYIGMNGLNNRGVGVCVNALLQLDHRVDGLPVAFVVRGILEQESFGKAIGFVQGIDHASGQSYTIGSSGEIATFECSAHKKARCTPSVGATRLCHTNHPLASDDQAIYGRIKKKYPPQSEVSGPSGSEIRMDTLKKRLSDRDAPFTVDGAKAALGSHDDPRMAVCAHGPGAFTFGCTVVEFCDPPLFHVAPGPGCKTEFAVYRF